MSNNLDANLALLRHLPNLASLSIACLTALLTYQKIIDQPDLQQGHIGAVEVIPAVVQAPISRLQPASAEAVATWHLFGKAPASNLTTNSQKSAQQPVKAKKTALKLKLLGVFSATDNKAGHAIIADRQKTGHYRVGEAVRAGVILEAVDRDRVILSNRGVIESLPIFKPGAGKNSSRAAPENRFRFRKANARQQYL